MSHSEEGGKYDANRPSGPEGEPPGKRPKKDLDGVLRGAYIGHMKAQADGAKLEVGQAVTYAGYVGTVKALPEWAPGMAEVLLRSGLTCVAIRDLKPADR